MELVNTKLATAAAAESFCHFILKNPGHKKLLGIALMGAAVQFTIFKLAYPYAGFYGDSYWYIYAAQHHLDFNIWPIGYSKFLLIMHAITHSDTLFVITQYALYIFAALAFFYTLLYWFKPGRLARNVIFGLLFFNPLLLYISNNISSDGLFLSISLVWFSLLLWIVFRPTLWLILLHALVLGLAFPIRYNALYYPCIAALGFILSSASIGKKIIGITLPVVFIAAFIIYTRHASDQLVSGYKTFSAFSGWQWANNALYMYPYISVEEGKLPANTYQFHTVVDSFFTTPNRFNTPKVYKTPLAGAFYIWHPKAPLMRYRQLKGGRTATDPCPRDVELREWIRLGPTYATYGKHLILHHPLPYARYFLLPNTLNYFLPQLEQMALYNDGRSKIPPLAWQWFDYETNRIPNAFPYLQKIIAIPLRIFFAGLNFSFLYYIFYFFRRKQKPLAEKSLRHGFYVVIALYLVNMGFSILASPIMLRYQLFPITVLTTFACMFILPGTAAVPAPVEARVADAKMA